MENVTSVVPAIHHSAGMYAAGLTATGLTDLLLNVDAEASSTAKARIKVILDGLCNVPLAEGRQILTEVTKTAKGKPTEQTVKQRVSECRQLYGAVRLIEGFRKGIEDSNMGWSNSVSRARVELASAGLKANGDRIKSKDEIKAEKAVKVMTATLAENLIGVDTSDEGRVAEIAQTSAERANLLGASAGMVKAQAERIVKAYGMAYAVALSDAIVDLFNKAEESADVTEEQQAA